ncbi:MAG: hypothetical protein LBP63_01580 [Prevotellaceae bacterium]|jgi:hypothetical protein|nr:hypothetical protein [Prevotellaceae bacterium]
MATARNILNFRLLRLENFGGGFAMFYAAEQVIVMPPYAKFAKYSETFGAYHETFPAHTEDVRTYTNAVCEYRLLRAEAFTMMNKLRKIRAQPCNRKEKQ